MSDAITEEALKIFGELTILKKVNILNVSTILCKDDKLYQMNQGDKKSTRLKESLWVESFMRCYSDCIMTSMNALR